jgi:hypothetical protein
MRSSASQRAEMEAAQEPPPEPMPGPKGLLVDNLGNCALFVASAAFLLAFLGAVVAGSMGPPIFSTASNDAATLNVGCPDRSSCNVTWTGTLTDMSPYHQVMWLSGNMERPKMADGSWALDGFPAAWNMAYDIDLFAVQGDGQLVLLAQNVPHVLPMSFGPGDKLSGDALLFATTEIRYPVFRLTARFKNALGPFGNVVSIGNTIRMTFTMSFVNKAYTAFEMGWKIFFTTTSVLLFLMYTGLLCWCVLPPPPAFSPLPPLLPPSPSAPSLHFFTPTQARTPQPPAAAPAAATRTLARRCSPPWSSPTFGGWAWGSFFSTTPFFH